MSDFSNFPKALRELMKDFEVVEDIEGRIGDRILKLMNDEKAIQYLKIGDKHTSGNELFTEYEVLSWLASKDLKTPNPICFKVDKDKGYLLMSNVEGKKAYDMVDVLSIKEIVKIAAEALKEIHNIDCKSVPNGLKNRLGHELDDVKKSVENDWIDVEAFKKANDNRSPKLIMEYLFDRRSLFADNVFTHGDYCLPNLLIHYGSKYEHEFSHDCCDFTLSNDQSHVIKYGFVDWAQAGIGDIYRDISPMIKSINRNFGEGYLELFFEYYGIKKDAINHEKIKYYDLIDQFTYYRIQ